MLSKRETAGAERKSFSGSTPIPVGMVWIGLVWYYLPWHAVACGRIQTQVFPFRQDFTQHIVPRSYKRLYIAFCSVFASRGQIIRLNGKNASQRILAQNRGYLQSAMHNCLPETPVKRFISCRIAFPIFSTKKAKIAGAERKFFSGSAPTPIGMVWIGLVWIGLDWFGMVWYYLLEYTREYSSSFGHARACPGIKSANAGRHCPVQIYNRQVIY